MTVTCCTFYGFVSKLIFIKKTLAQTLINRKNKTIHYVKTNPNHNFLFFN